jgi:hypothetical protein
MFDRNKPKKNRSVTNRSTVQSPEKIIATRDNPLYNIGPNHPDYQNVIKQDTSILDIPDGTIQGLTIEDIASVPISPYNPPLTSAAATYDPVTMSAVLPPTSLAVDTVNATAVKGADGTITNTIKVLFTDANGAVNYEVAVKEVV